MSNHIFVNFCVYCGQNIFSCFHNIFLKVRINNHMAGYLAAMDRDEKYILKWIYKCKRPQFFVLQLTGAIFFSKPVSR